MWAAVVKMVPGWDSVGGHPLCNRASGCWPPNHNLSQHGRALMGAAQRLVCGRCEGIPAISFPWTGSALENPPPLPRELKASPMGQMCKT